MNTTQPMNSESATLGGGCFWCLQPVFQALRGVQRVTAGYAGGDAPAPSYDQVCTGGTGHAEVVQIEFDPEEISYRQLLEVFFAMHDPTTLNRQGADVGTQYRSIILAHNPKQAQIARATIADLGNQAIWSRPIVTQVEPFRQFYPAEDYHQDYYARHPNAGYCQLVIAPKLAKFRKKYAARLS